MIEAVVLENDRGPSIRRAPSRALQGARPRRRRLAGLPLRPPDRCGPRAVARRWRDLAARARRGPRRPSWTRQRRVHARPPGRARPRCSGCGSCRGASRHDRPGSWFRRGMENRELGAAHGIPGGEYQREADGNAGAARPRPRGATGAEHAGVKCTGRAELRTPDCLDLYAMQRSWARRCTSGAWAADPTGMTRPELAAAVLALPDEEKLGSLVSSGMRSATPDPCPTWHKEELDRRVAAADANPTSFVSWPEAKARILGAHVR